MKVKCIETESSFLTENKVYDARFVNTRLKVIDDGGCEFTPSSSRFEIVKQTPYEYLLDFYGLEKGKSYFEDSCTWRALSTDVLLAKMIKNQISIKRLMNGNLCFTEIKPKKSVTLELTDEQLAKIKEIIAE